MMSRVAVAVCAISATLAVSGFAQSAAEVKSVAWWAPQAGASKGEVKQYTLESQSYGKPRRLDTKVAQK